ncbi:electron transfer flavoprotein subunit alpha/FixB family protein [Haloplanus aerogenes]|uniref:Electron transfer flavoprotein alpha subunit n=1 Tax=Haloplanus aerogenes TaxID=660522 RepID=A0A3M0CRR7_9EURY|nr:electron transfer flavoprotein subunit alpha/FixB family protein [Haloplanus aerogenes]AZH25969.1 electron transfer flavoprotein subunit alpha/FixB family protein [Haloplanus aerogenes]RMB11667.1 electron transfer flavoprotein alpha subunit [Haloplanus aerogenes]
MVLAFVEHDGGELDDASAQTLTLARDLATGVDEPLEAIAFGPEATAVAHDAGVYGATVVNAVEHDDLDNYAPEAYARTVVQCAEGTGTDAVVAPGTDRGSEVLAHAAAKLDETMAAEVVEVDPDGDAYQLTRQRWGGTLLEHARLDADTKVLTVAPNEVSASPTDDDPADVNPFTPDLEAGDLRVQCLRTEASDTEGVPLGEARIVVSGGRGTDGDFEALEELAERLPDAAVGASRAAVNEGWRPHDDQIGQTGTKIAPEIYIPCGISGAVQHMVGCKGAENILAVNTDPDAAIVGKADWVVVANLHEVVPAVVEELDRRTE